MAARKKKAATKKSDTVEVIINAAVTPYTGAEFEAEQKKVYARCKEEGKTPEQAMAEFDTFRREHMTLYPGQAVELPRELAEKYLESGIASEPDEPPEVTKRRMAEMGVSMPNEQQRAEIREAMDEAEAGD